MRMRHAAVVAGLALGLMSTAARAAYVVNIQQVDANVVATGSGSIDLSKLTFLFPNLGVPGQISGGFNALFVGASENLDIYSGSGTIIGPTSFGFGDAFASNSLGNSVGIRTGNNSFLPEFFVPVGYSSGDLGTSTDTFNNTTLANLGFTPGESLQFVTTGSDGESLVPFFTINVTGSVSAVPLPASAPMFGAALLALGAVGYGVKRKKAAPAA